LDYSYTFTPSRLIFPRGFLWDDGFHLSIAVHYNTKLTLNVIHNWMRKIDLFGWIGREQIRGW
jgi:mannosyl-oligosaccharide glucosidase